MTAVLFDGFDMGDSVHRWTGSVDQHLTSPVRTGTHSLQMGTGTGNTYYALDAVEEDDVMYVGFGYYQTPHTLKSDILQLGEGHDVGPTHVRLRRDAFIRGWEVLKGDGSVLIAAIPNSYFPNSWHYIEFGAKIHDTTGWVELRQDGITVGRFDGDTRNGGTDALIDLVNFHLDGATGHYYLDDVYILNEQGSVNNTWLGDTRCYPLYPNGNGTSSTPLSGSDGNSTDNYLLVDEAGLPVTTDYVFSATPGDQDTYTFQDLPVTLGTIRGVEIRLHAAKDDTGTKQIRAITRRLSTDSFGPDHVLAAIPLYQTHHDLDELDPHAGPGLWTIDNVNATEWGVEVRS